MIYAVIAVAGILVVIMVARIVGGANAKTARNTTFLSQAVASEVLQPTRPAQVTAPLAAGAPHAVWLDLSIDATSDVTFELALSVEINGKVEVGGTYPVTFNDEHDARGLPNPPGISALNTKVASLGKRTRIDTTLRAFRFDAPASGDSKAVIAATIVPGPGVTFERARLLVTSPDAPEGSGKLPAGMRAIG